MPAIGAAGELYVTDALNGSVFRLDGERCVVFAEGWSRPYGVAVLDDGRVCVSHYTSDDPLTRETAVSCRNGAGWTMEVRGLGSGINGLAATPAGIWLAEWEAVLRSVFAQENSAGEYIPQWSGDQSINGFLFVSPRPQCQLPYRGTSNLRN